MPSIPAVEERVAKRLTETRQTLATAESCSGGLIAHRVTSVPGASVFFLGGIVAYGNAVKTAQLGVPENLLAAHGAVSEPVAQAMAEGVRGRFGTDFGVAVTGIAGPTGGTPAKPVGLVYVAVAQEGQNQLARHVFEGSRASIKEQTAEAALVLLWEQMQG